MLCSITLTPIILYLLYYIAHSKVTFFLMYRVSIVNWTLNCVVMTHVRMEVRAWDWLERTIPVPVLQATLTTNVSQGLMTQLKVIL